MQLYKMPNFTHVALLKQDLKFLKSNQHVCKMNPDNCHMTWQTVKGQPNAQTRPPAL